MSDNAIIEGKLVESYPTYLAPLAKSYEVTETFTTNSILDTYELIVEHLVTSGDYKLDGKAINQLRIPTSAPLRKFIKKVEFDRFLIPASLYSLPGDIDVFAQKVLGWINHSWSLKEGNKLHPRLEALTTEHSTVAFVPPAMKEFTNLSPKLVLSLFTALKKNSVFYYASTIPDIVAKEIVKETNFKAEDVSKLDLKPGLKGLEKYFTVLPANSLRTLKALAPKAALWNYGGLAGITATTAGLSFMMPPAFTATVLISSGIFALGVGVFSTALRYSETTVVLLTPEGELLYKQLLSWNRYQKQVSKNAKYGSALNFETSNSNSKPKKNFLSNLLN